MVFVVFESLLNPAQLRQLREALLPEGFADGALTARGDAQRVKKNLQFAHTHPQWAACSDLIIGAVNACQPILQYVSPVRITSPIFNLYEEGMSYGMHTDAALMSAAGLPMRTDYSMTIFLSGTDEYDGGELVLSPDGQPSMAVKLNAGSAVVYLSSMLHQVRPVVRGQRFAAVMWMQSALPSEVQRNVVQDLDRVRSLLDGNNIAEARERLRLARENLVRMFAQP